MAVRGTLHERAIGAPTRAPWNRSGWALVLALALALSGEFPLSPAIAQAAEPSSDQAAVTQAPPDGPTDDDAKALELERGDSDSPDLSRIGASTAGMRYTVRVETDPRPQTAQEGARATFSAYVKATDNLLGGPASLTYQWEYRDAGSLSNVNVPNSGVSDGRSDSYSTPLLTSTWDGRKFRLVGTAPDGTWAATEWATLTVTAPPAPAYDPPTITRQPVGQATDDGGRMTFSVAATGDGHLDYQWYYAEGIVSNSWKELSGRGSFQTYTTPAFPVGVYTFKVVVRSEYGSAESVSVSGVVRAIPPRITKGPSDVSVASLGRAKFTVEAVGSGELKYQWYSSGDGGKTFEEKMGYTDSTLETVVSDSMDGKLFRVTVTSPYGSATSEAAKLTVGSPPSIYTEPNDVTVVEGNTASFSVWAVGSGPLSYQWQWAHKGSNDWSKETSGPSATTSTLTTSPREMSFDGFRYRVVVTNEFGSVTSKVVTLHVVKATKITTQPVDVTVPDQGVATFSVVTSGPDGLRYYWERSTDGGIKWTSVSEAGSAYCEYASTCRFGKVTMDDDKSLFRVVVKSDYESVTSATATLTVVGVSPTLALHPGDQLTAAGSTVTFKSLGSGTGPLTYQWQKRVAGSEEWIDLPGETGRDLAVRSVASIDNGDHYRVVITSPYGLARSRAARLSVVSVAGVQLTVDTQAVQVDALP